ncbi:helix-turn-helix domain-containing protein [Streptomyces sp. BI20]|uniref:helix-turn-helix domain-containing protein n=1 Tax=Streptomyces sp. BI20 TaxID=3403460 RepID=UPI003C7501DC
MKSVQGFSPQRLKDARADRSQAVVAAAVGVTENTYGRWERGKGAPSAKAFGRLLEVLSVTADDLVEPLGDDADIAALRTRAGLRQVDVAEVLAIQPSDVSELEAGKVPLREEWVGPLSSLFGVPAARVRSAGIVAADRWRAEVQSIRP